MYGAEDICRFRRRYVGVILYPHSQAKHFVGNCMAPVTETLIYAYI